LNQVMLASFTASSNTSKIYSSNLITLKSFNSKIFNSKMFTYTFYLNHAKPLVNN
jgi:hypothetical protein